MRALVFIGTHQLEVQERPTPEAGPGESLIQIIATGICGSDLHGYTGENGRRHAGQVMGHETVGRIVGHGPVDENGLDVEPSLPPAGALVTINPVISCGHCPACASRAEQSCPDRRVIGVDPAISSAFAEFVVVPTRNVVPLSSTLPPALGALVEPLSVGYHAARRGRVTAQTKVLVLGGGPIGQATALAAQRLGGRVVVSEPMVARRGLLTTLGFDAVDPDAPSFTELVSAVLDGGPEVVLDAVATSQTLRQALTVSAIGATVVMVGMNAPEVQVPAYRIITEERTIVGSFCYSADEFADTAAWVSTHSDRLAALVGAYSSLEQAPATFADLAAGRQDASKVLVYMSEPLMA